MVGDTMKNKNIDLSGIKENDLDKTSSFTDLMSRKERRNRHKIYEEVDIEKVETKEEDIDIEDIINEKKKSSKDLDVELFRAKEEYNDTIKPEKEKELEKTNNLEKTQILELTRQMKFNFDEKREENAKHKKRWISPINVIGEVSLVCIGYYIYLLVFTSYQDIKKNYLINGTLIVLLVILFGLSAVTNKKISKFFNILNILAIFAFIIFNAYTLLH